VCARACVCMYECMFVLTQCLRLPKISCTYVHKALLALIEIVAYIVADLRFLPDTYVVLYACVSRGFSSQPVVSEVH
jgi:hypothetical protein